MTLRGNLHQRLTHRLAHPRTCHHPVFGTGIVHRPTTAAIKKALRDPKTTKEERKMLYSWLMTRKLER